MSLKYKCNECDNVMESTKSTVSCESCDIELGITEAEDMFEAGKLVVVLSEMKDKKDDEYEDSDGGGKSPKEEDSDDEEEDSDKEADDAEDSDDEDEVKEEGVEFDFSVDVSEDINALLAGEELSEEFGTKAKTIFEAAVTRKVKEQLSILEAKQLESNEAAVLHADKKLNTYLDYVVTEWMAENKLAVDTGIKADMNESFLEGMKVLFEDHYLDIPEEKVNMIESLTVKIDALQEDLDSQIEKNVNLFADIKKTTKASLVKDMSEGLADTDKEKFLSLTENLSYEDEDSFKSELNTIKESYFSKEGGETSITEDIDIGGDYKTEKDAPEQVDSLVQSVLAVMKSNN